MMLIRTNVIKNSDDATDFENNGKTDAIPVNKIIFNGVVFIKTDDYSDFKSKIDGNVITWKNVRYIEGKHNYELWLEVQ